jgi:uncharacterized protein (TIGR03084 family)
VTDLAALVDDLEAEQRSLADAVRDLDDDEWLSPTPSWQWDVRDTIAHLADTDAVAVDTAIGGPRPLNVAAAASASAEDTTYRGVLRGRRLRGVDVLAWWQDVASAERKVLRGLDPGVRVPWGIGMGATAFVTARLMETWAHGLDVRAALRVEAVDTDRLAHVAWIATRALPYAYSVVGRSAPSPPIRVELTLPSGAPWTTGPAAASDRITGPAGEYCRVFVQRLPLVKATGLRAEGSAAKDALQVARAYL